MIINSHNIEFGYELISVLPYAYNLHLNNKLKGSISGNDTECLYYFSKSHKINKNKRSWYNTEKVTAPNIKIHRNTLDLNEWTPPPLKDHYKNKKFKFKKETVIICNRHNVEWNDKPINFFDEKTLKELFELLKDKYQVIYINVDGRPELYDNAEPIPLKDYELLKEYPEVINIHDLHKKHKELSFNTLQLMLFANCEKYITMNGGHAILAAYFGGENIIMSKYGEPQAKELHPSVNSFYRWYDKFGGQRVLHVENEIKLIDKVKSLYVNKEPIINILVRTSSRKKYFETCINTILEQDYQNINIWVSIDNNDKYPIKHPVYPVYISKHEISDIKEKNKIDGIVFPYNHYINIIQDKINTGYIMYLDDDDKLNDNKVVSNIANEIKKGNDLVFWKVKIGEKILPPPELFGKEPKLFNISGIGYCFNSKYKEHAFWRPFKRADFNCAKSLHSNIKNKSWIDKVLASTQDGSHAGLRIDKTVLKLNEEMVRIKVKVKIVKDSFNNIKLKYKVGEVVELTDSKAKQFVLNGIAKPIKAKK